jgi:hypothetical protein
MGLASAKATSFQPQSSLESALARQKCPMGRQTAGVLVQVQFYMAFCMIA